MASNSDDDEFNSSDGDFSVPGSRPEKSVILGEASVKSIVAHAEEDRILSKRRVENLTYHAREPTTQYMTELWKTRLQTFMKETLLLPYETTPFPTELS